MKHIEALVLSAMVALNSVAADFDSVVDMIVSTSPRVENVRSASVAGLNEMKLENNLGETEVEFERLWSRDGTKTGVGVSQSFDWPGLYRARDKAYKSAAVLADKTVLAAVAEVRTETVALLVDMVAARKSIALLENISDGYRKMLEVQAVGYQNGSVSVLDVNKLRIELTRSRVELDQRRDDLAVIIGRLEELSGNDNLEPILSEIDGFPLMTIAPLEDYKRGLIENDPSLLAAEAALDADVAAVDVAGMSRYPGFSVGYAFEREEMENFHGFSVGLSLPLFSSRGKVAAARSRVMASEFSLNSARTAALKTLENDYRRLMAMKRQMDEYGPVVENVDNVSLLQRAFDGGQITLTSYLQDLNYFLEANLSYYDLVARYHGLLASLSRYL